MIVQICTLYPYEPSGVRAKVKRQKKKLERGKVEPIKVLLVDDEYLVVDGNNTVLAALEMGMTELEATEAHRSEQEMRPYRDALAEAKAKDMRGFENVPVDSSMTDRSKRY